jgi:hypothetical protein
MDLALVNACAGYQRLPEITEDDPKHCLRDAGFEAFVGKGMV